jgi:hypothetical protein
MGLSICLHLRLLHSCAVINVCRDSLHTEEEIYIMLVERDKCGAECEGTRSSKFEDSVDVRSSHLQLFNRRVKLPLDEALGRRCVRQERREGRVRRRVEW